MKGLIWILIVLAIAVGFVHFMADDAGYALLSWGPWQFESSFAFLLASIVLTCLVLSVLYKTLWRLVGLIPAFAESRVQKKRARSRESLVSGLLEMSEGHWTKAEKTLVASATNSDTPIIHYLAAAQASQLQGNIDKRDQYLALVSEENPSSELAVAITRVENLINAGQWNDASKQLTDLATKHPNHRRILELQQKSLIQQRDWQALKALIPALKKHKVLDKRAAEDLDFRCTLGLLETAIDLNDSAKVNPIWDKLSRNERTSPRMVHAYARYLNSKNELDSSIRLITNALDKHWDTDLITLYGKTHSTQISTQIKKAQSWLKRHPEDPALLLALGRLCTKDQNWANAQVHLDHCAQLQPSPEVFEALAQLMLLTNRQNDALTYMQKGLALKSTPTLPVPASQ